MSHFIEATLTIALVVFFLWVIALVGVGLHTSANCLELGYPDSAVTWKFDRYCRNLEGTVYIRVEKL